MTAIHDKIDWSSVRERLERSQIQGGESEPVDRNRLNEVFRQRAQRLARRGREETTQAKRTPFVVFRLGNERFGIELAQVKQIFPSVPTAPIPGAGKLLLGVANLNGSLRSIVDLRILLNLPTAPADAGNFMLLNAGEKSLGVWVETLDGVSQIDLDRLIDVYGTASESVGKLAKGMTDDRILALDATVLVACVADQMHRSTDDP